MRKSKLTEHQIVGILKQYEAGAKVADICREHAISNATFYQWKAKYGGLDASRLKQFKDLQEENNRLKRMYAELSMMHDALKQVVEKKWGPDEQREIVQALITEHGHTLRQACRNVGLARSTAQYRKHPPDDTMIISTLDQLTQGHPAIGVWHAIIACD